MPLSYASISRIFLVHFCVGCWPSLMLQIWVCCFPFHFDLSGSQLFVCLFCFFLALQLYSICYFSLSFKLKLSPSWSLVSIFAVASVLWIHFLFSELLADFSTSVHCLTLPLPVSLDQLEPHSPPVAVVSVGISLQRNSDHWETHTGNTYETYIILLWKRSQTYR